MPSISLDKWLISLWMLVNCKNGVSSYEISRALGITQKSAWFVLQRLRLALRDGTVDKFGGPGSEVEVDESFIGGKEANKHRSKRHGKPGTVGKVVAMGMVERDGELRLKTIPHTGHMRAEIVARLETHDR